MGCGGKIFNTLRDEPAHVKLVYYVANDLANCRDTVWKGNPIAAGEFITSRANMAELCSLSEKQIRFAWKRLAELNVLKTSGEGKRHTRVTILKGQEKGPEKGQVNVLKNRFDSQIKGPEKGQEKGHSLGVDVHALSHSPAVDVSPALSRNVKDGTPRATPIVHKSGSTSTARYEAAIERAPDLPHVTMYVDRLFAEISRGKKYPWAGNRFAATILADLIVSHGAGLVMAAAETFFRRGDKWTEERAWSIDEFGKQFAKLIASDAAARRAVDLAAELKDQGRPTSPKELKAQLAAMRRREEEAVMASYQPNEVHFREDVKKLRAKEPAVV